MYIYKLHNRRWYLRLERNWSKSTIERVVYGDGLLISLGYYRIQFFIPVFELPNG